MQLISKVITRNMLVQRPEGRTLPVIFLGDIQWAGSAGDQTSLRVLRETVQRGLGIGALFLGMGDYVDTFSPSNRARLSGANLYDTATQVIDDKNADLVAEIFEKALKPTKGKWLGLLAGHHWHQFKHGDTTDMRLAKLLDAPFLGDSAVVRLEFRMGDDVGHKTIPGTIWCHHGAGNGQTGYYPLTRLEKVSAAWEEVDIFAMGHTTKQAVESTNKLHVRWATKDLTHRKILLVGSGGYSKTYVENAMQGLVYSGGYAEKRMLAPSIMGSPVVWFWPKRNNTRLSLDISGEA